MRSSPLLHDVRQIADYKDAQDSAEFHRLFDYLVKVRTKIIQGPLTVKWGRPSFEKLEWRPRDTTLAFEPDGKLSALGAGHHALHYMIYRRYRLPMKGSPLLTLMIECVASNFDLYMATELVRKKKARNRIVKYFILSCQRFSLGSTAEFMRVLKTASKDSFEFYRTVVLEMFEYAQLALNSCIIDNPSKAQIRKTQRWLDNAEYRYLYGYYDLENFILYTLALCGTKSLQRDLRAVKDLVGHLKKSKTFLEFIDRIET